MLLTPQPGTLHLIRGQSNPNGAADADVYVLRGDATAGPVTRIVPVDGAQLPPTLLPLSRPVQVKLLHFNDLHGQVCRIQGEEGTWPVFSRIAAALRAVRGQSAGDVVLAVTAGDDCGGVIFDELLGRDAASFQLHAGYRLYAAAGIDVGVIGNHDLDRGDAVLAEAIRRDARFPVLVANVAGSSALTEGSYPAALFVVRGVRIGFVGLVTPGETHREPDCSWRVTDPVQAARNLLPALRPLCDVLIILSHLGYSLDRCSAAAETAGDVELARSLPPGSVDLIVGGHTHDALNADGLSACNVINGIPIVQAGHAGQFLGEVDIAVGAAPVIVDARLRMVEDLPVDAAFEAAHVQPLVARMRPYRARVLGRVASEADLRADAVHARLATGESAFANFSADALVAQARACGYAVDFAMIDRTVVGCGLPAGGELTFGQWFNVMPYSDVLSLFRLSGRQLQALLQDNALRIDRPDEAHIERGFLHFSAGLRYVIQPGSTRSQARAIGIQVNGCHLESCLERSFLVASTNFVRGLAAAWEADAAKDVFAALLDLGDLQPEFTHLYVRDLLVDYILAHGGVLPEGGARRDGRLAVLI